MGKFVRLLTKISILTKEISFPQSQTMKFGKVYSFDERKVRILTSPVLVLKMQKK